MPVQLYLLFTLPYNLARLWLNEDLFHSNLTVLSKKCPRGEKQLNDSSEVKQTYLGCFRANLEQKEVT